MQPKVDPTRFLINQGTKAMSSCRFKRFMMRKDFLLSLSFLTCAIVVFGNCYQVFASGGKAQHRRVRPGSRVEKFCGAEVCPQQVLFKVNECTTKFDLKTLAAKLQTEFRKSDATIEVNQVGNDCIFLAKSKKLDVKSLMLSLPAFIEPGVKQLKSSDMAGLKFDFIEPDFRVHVAPSLPSKVPVDPTDDLFQKGKLWGLQNKTYPGFDIDAVRAWRQFSNDASSIVVGVVDTGIYGQHPDLRQNMWSAQGTFTVTVAGKPITCKKGDFGFDALANKCDANDVHGHGTEVAGIIGAVGDNGIGSVGVAPHVKLMALRFMDAEGKGCISEAINAIEFALQAQLVLKSEANLRVLNNSWGYIDSGDCSVESKALKDEMEKASRQDVVFVASAGEDNKTTDNPPHYPSGFSAFDNLLSVTAIQENGALTIIHGIKSNLGMNSVHLAAPGIDIWTTCLARQNYYCELDFTSAAAPFVSGSAALMWSVPACAQLHSPGIRNKLLEGSVRTDSMIDPISLQNLTVTGGRLNLYNSIVACSK